MNKINFARVLLGGIVAGFIINVGEVVLNGIILGPHIAEDLKRMNLTPPGNGFAALAIALSFVLGIVAILIYVMMRARLGPGPKSALLTALVVWFCVYAYSGTLNMLIISVPPKLVLMVLGWGIVEYPLGVLVGAALYKEPGSE